MTANTIWPTPTALVQDWFAIDAPSPGVFRIQEPLHEENVKSFLVIGADRALLLDTGMGVGDIRAVIESITTLPLVVVNSHAHWDHIGGNRHFDDIHIHEAEVDGLVHGVANDVLRPWFRPERLRGPLPDGITADSISYPPSPLTGTLEGGEEIDLGERALEVIHCPGHSPGGIALWDPHQLVLFTTDVAYPCTLYVDHEGDLPAYLASLDRLTSLSPAPRWVFGSHCDVEMPMAMLAAQRNAIAAIIDGLAPTEASENGITRWAFDGFALELKNED